jgi:peptidoglycan/LPS O-acetylase OafA/YrhL
VPVRINSGPILERRFSSSHRPPQSAELLTQPVDPMEPKLRYRADIDGLRAIAVLLVVGFHAFPDFVPGGFVGVDVFFVISGYLISTLIITSLDVDKFSFAEFYTRRIKRIFPALIIVLACVLPVGWAVLFGEEFRQAGKHVAGGAAFVSNWLLWNESGYFNSDAATKPLLHLWSLGVEEQFYILWPPLLWIAHKNKISLIFVIATIGVLSFALNLWTVHTDAFKAFFSPQTRLWELLIGAALAWRTIRSGVPENGSARSMAGLLLLVAATCLINESSAFPGAWALLPTLGAALIVSAGSRAWINQKCLAHPALVWVGLISYPLYLWHWPILSFLRIVNGQQPDAWVRVAAIVASIALAWTTYKLIELPIRRSNSPQTARLSLVAGLAVIFAVGATVYLKKGLPGREVNAAFLNFDRRLAERSHQSDGSCKARMNMESVDEEVCLTTSEHPSILFFGDSHAMSLFSSIPDERSEFANKAMIVSGVSCLPYANLTYIPTHQRVWGNNCTELSNEAIRIAENFASIATVIIATRQPWVRSDSLSVYKERGEPVNELTAFMDGNAYLIGRMLMAGKRVVYVIDVPTLKNLPSSCERRLSFIDPKDCNMTEEEFEASRLDYMAAVRGLKMRHPSLVVFDASRMVCAEGLCDAKRGGEYLYVDTDHLSVPGSAKAISLLSHEMNQSIGGRPD